MSNNSSGDCPWAVTLPSLFDTLVSSPAKEKDNEAYRTTIGDRLSQSPSPSWVDDPALPRPIKILPFENAKEARLFMYYVHELSSWLDICDRQRHFGREVPRRACHFPLIAYSILAFSSRQLSLVSDIVDDDSDVYYGQALRMLIPVLDDPIGALTEDILAAIVILRLYEEMCDGDTGTHLYGSSRILNSMSSFAATGGLGEAASWIVLRQDMYWSLTHAQPLLINLEFYKRSRAFLEDSAEALANRAVYLCAQVMALCFQPGGCLDLIQWEELNEMVKQWPESQPPGIRPLWVNMSGDGSVSAFPAVWMSQQTHVISYQHYHIARMLLTLFDPDLWVPSLDAFWRRRQADQTVANDLRMVVGLAMSNMSAVAAAFTASHTLQMLGSVLTGQREQEEALGFFREFQKATGWRTEHIMETLMAQWSLDNTNPAFRWSTTYN